MCRGIDESITLGGTSILSETAGIVDTGTTLILIASGMLEQVAHMPAITDRLGLIDAFSSYQRATGGVIDETTGLLRVTSAQFADLPTLSFNISGTTFELTANAQAWPVRIDVSLTSSVNNEHIL